MSKEPFLSPGFNVRDFGASGDMSRDTQNFQKAIGAAHDSYVSAAAGTSDRSSESSHASAPVRIRAQFSSGPAQPPRVKVIVPAGNYLIAPVRLLSGVDLHIQQGATLFASQLIEEFPVIVARWEGSTRETYAPLVYAESADNIALTGAGCIDGCGEMWWRLFREKSLAYPRPRLIGFTGCEHVLVEGLHLRNSPSWTVNPVRCRDLVVRNLDIYSPPDSPNTDGINPDSCDGVLIEGCHVSVGDDCITLKSGTELEKPELRAATKNVLIRDCLLERGHGAVVIGSEMSGGVSNVTVERCQFVGTDRGIRMKSRRGRGGIVEDVSISDIEMKNVLCPFTINMYYGCGAWGDPVVSDKATRLLDFTTPVFRNISLKNIKAIEVRYAAAFLYGLPESPIRNLNIENYCVEMAESVLTDGSGDPASSSFITAIPDPETAAGTLPSSDGGYPEMADGIPAMSREGLFARNISGLRFDRIKIERQRGPQFLVSDCSGIETDQPYLSQQHPV